MKTWAKRARAALLIDQRYRRFGDDIPNSANSVRRSIALASPLKTFVTKTPELAFHG